MKNLGLFFAAMLLCLPVRAQEKQGVSITVIIENVLSDQGTILGSLHTLDTFMKGPGIVNVAEPAKKGEITLKFTNISPGTYAIVIMHDANDNRRMDMDPSGMPLENYATTGDSMVMGPPTFEAAKFEVTHANLEYRIRF
jgi:uncharacterized protein (DUF2141 family)